MLQSLAPESTDAAEALPMLGKLSDEARALLQPSVNVRGFVDALVQQGRYGDVLDVITQLLPRPYAVAWGYECLAELAQRAAPPPAELAALAATRRWIAEPSEDNRRAALELSDRLGLQSPGSWLAAAAGWTGGSSMLPPGRPDVPVAPTLTGDAVAAALRLAAASDPSHFDERMQSFVHKALEVFAPGAQGAGA